jgi:hypothetical protein
MPVELIPVAESDPVHILRRKIQLNDFPYLDQLQTPLDIRIFWAIPAKEGKPALKKNGRPLITKATVTSYEKRVDGGGDVMLKIDRPAWNELDVLEQESEIFSFLYALDFPGMMKGGDVYVPVLDLNERPIVKLKVPDVYISGYKATIDRYGDDCIEKQTLDMVIEALSQQSFPFMRTDGPTEFQKGAGILPLGPATAKLRGKSAINAEFSQAAMV